MKIGSKLLNFRKKVKLSQQDVADQIGVKQSTYNRWENDATQPSLDFLPKLATALNVSIPDLIPDATNIHIFQNNNEYSVNGYNIQGTPNFVLEKLLIQLEMKDTTIQNQNVIIQKPRTTHFKIKLGYSGCKLAKESAVLLTFSF